MWRRSTPRIRLELRWLHSARCDDVSVAAGPADRAAISCFRNLDGPRKHRRSYELFFR